MTAPSLSHTKPLLPLFSTKPSLVSILAAATLHGIPATLSPLQTSPARETPALPRRRSFRTAPRTRSVARMQNCARTKVRAVASARAFVALRHNAHVYSPLPSFLLYSPRAQRYAKGRSDFEETRARRRHWQSAGGTC